MLPSTTYFAGNELRWDLLWNSPNHAGAFAAAAAPWLWVLLAVCFARGRWIASAALFLIEAALAWALVKTYSRGALLGYFSAGLVFVCLQSELPRLRAALAFAVTRLTLFLMLHVSAGETFARLNPHYIVTDGSTLNRVALYAGGLAMLADRPEGFGSGQSGSTFSQWYEPFDSDILYTGLVNTYIEIAAERGVIVLGAVIFVCALPISMGLAFPRRGEVCVSAIGAQNMHSCGPRNIATAACVSSVAFSVAAFFTTMSDRGSLWFPQAASVAGCAYCMLQTPTIARRCLALTAFGSVCTAGFAVLLGCVVSLRSGLRIKHTDQATAVETRAELDRPVMNVVVAPDAEVLGKLYGHAIRTIATDQPGVRLTTTVASSVLERQREDVLIVLTGTFVLTNTTHRGPAALICPAYPPSGEPPAGRRLIILGSWDELGLNHLWKDWALNHSVNVILLRSGQNIEAELPFLFQQITAWAFPKRETFLCAER